MQLIQLHQMDLAVHSNDLTEWHNHSQRGRHIYLSSSVKALAYEAYEANEAYEVQGFGTSQLQFGCCGRCKVSLITPLLLCEIKLMSFARN